MKRVSLLMLLLCAAMACSCTKEKQANESSGEEKKDEPQKPQDGTTLFGSYAYDDGSHLTNMFYSFANGNIYEYHLQGGKVVLAEGALWNTSLDDFTLSKSGAYQVADGSLYINGAMYGSLQMTSDRIIISDRTYSKFKDFKPAWYTTLSVETGDTLKHTYRKQEVNVPIKLDKSVSGSILAATVTQGNAWITNCSIDKGNLVFALAENNTGETRKGGIRVTCPGAEDLPLVVEQSYVSSQITLSAESQNAEYTGGTSSFTYTLENEREDTHVSASSGQNWISNIQVDESQHTVSYLVASNNSVNARQGKITVRYGSYDSADMTVNQSASPVQSLSLNKGSLDMLVGGTFNLVATVSPSDASLAWSSDKTSVATVTQNGVVTAKGIGTATITVSAQGGQKTASCEVTVKDTPTFSISNTTLTTYKGAGPQSILITSNSDCQFSATSSDQSVATVSVSGKTVSVTPVSVGEATITVNCPATQSYVSVPSLACGVVVLDIDISSAMDISEYPANCYIIPQTGVYKFKAVKGNSSRYVGMVSTAEVLWESFGTSSAPSKGEIISKSVFYKNYIYFETPSTLKNGNAVIAVEDASGNILWSWHIWVCKDYNPATSAQTYANNAGTMMDRNLGATSATPGNAGALGLLYQWGRKDPFLGGCSISSDSQAASTLSWPYNVSSNSSNGTIDYAVKHPTTFITYNSSNYDWYYTGSSSTDNTRWSSTKGMYDPCPPGWRVPDGGNNGVWSKAAGSSSYFSGYPYDDTNKGMNFNGKFGSAGTIWYPAAGYLRLDNDDSLSLVGGDGYWWSCTPNDYYAYGLDLGSDGSVTPSRPSRRAAGLSVRCLQE